MKKLLTIVLVMAITSLSFAQKDEIKAIEKALKNSNFADAKSAAAAAESLIGNMDDKSKAKFYLLNAKALYANGAGTDANIDKAITSLDNLKDLESKMGKLKYTQEANDMTTGMVKNFLTKAEKEYSEKNYNAAAKGFEKLYRMSPKDTLYLYYAASSAVSEPDYDTALDYYNQLKNIGYNGSEMNYYATNVETGVEENFSDKASRDFSVKAKLHKSPRDQRSQSKTAEIVRNIALIYVAQGENEKALGAMADARAENPDDIGLLLSEANVYYKMGNTEKFKDLMEEATHKDPENAELQFNLGVLAADAGSSEEAIKYYEKAVSINPNYVNAYVNIAVVILSEDESIIKEMNEILESKRPNYDQYDALKLKRSQIYLSAIPYLEKALELKSTSVDAARTLMNIYSSLGETEKVKIMKAKVEEIEASANGN